MANGLKQICPDWVKDLQKTGVPLAGCMVYVALRSYANRTSGHAWPKYETISQDWGIPRRTISRHISDLESMGLLKSKRGKRGKVFSFPPIKGIKKSEFRCANSGTSKTARNSLSRCANSGTSRTMEKAIQDVPTVAHQESSQDVPDLNLRCANSGTSPLRSEDKNRTKKKSSSVDTRCDPLEEIQKKGQALARMVKHGR